MTVNLHAVTKHNSATYIPTCNIQFTCPTCRNSFHFSSPNNPTVFSPRWQHYAAENGETEVPETAGVPRNCEIQQCEKKTDKEQEFDDKSFEGVESIELEDLDFPAEIDGCFEDQPLDVSSDELTQMALKYTFVSKDNVFFETEGMRSSPEDQLFG